MSGVIRLQLETVLATLKDKGRAVLTALNANDTSTQDDDHLELLAFQLKQAIGRAEVLVDKWYGVISRLLPTQQQEEMDVLKIFPLPRGEARMDDELTVLTQIERSYELVALANVELQQQRALNQGSDLSQRSVTSATVVKVQTGNAQHQTQQPLANGPESHSIEQPALLVRRPTQTNANGPTAAGNGANAQHTHLASQSGLLPYQQQGTGNGVPIYSTFRPFRLEPIKFSGDPREWTAFWLAFDRAVNSQPLPPFEKHLCLLQSLVPGSTARRAIEGYPISDENYLMVVNILRQQFGDVKALREGLIAELLHLPLANNSLFSMRNLREHVERICLQLESPEGSNATQDEIVCGIIRSKLPSEALETLIGWEEDEHAVWTLGELRNGLGRLVQLKERLEFTITTLHQNKLEQPTVLEEQPHYNQTTERSDHHEPTDVSYSCMTTQSPGPLDEQHALLARPLQSPLEEYGCSLCHTGSTHKPSRCPMFNSRNRRRARLLEQGRCLNCLYDGHMLNKCRAANKCRRCGGRHHFMLCTKRQPKKRVYYPIVQHDGPSNSNWRQPQSKKRVYYRTGHHEGPSEANWRVNTPPQPEVTYSGMVFTSSLNDSEADTKSSTSSTNRHRRRKVWINSKLKANLLKSKNGQVTSQPNKASICSTSFSNAGKSLCVTQAGTTAAVTCGIIAAATEGITESATEQTTTNCSTTAKINGCDTRVGITQAAATTMDKINLLLSETTSRRRPRKSCSSDKGQQRGSQVVECRPSPKAQRGKSRKSTPPPSSLLWTTPCAYATCCQPVIGTDSAPHCGSSR